MGVPVVEIVSLGGRGSKYTEGVEAGPEGIKDS